MSADTPTLALTTAQIEALAEEIATWVASGQARHYHERIVGCVESVLYGTPYKGAEVARLRAEVERLTSRPACAVSEHLRARIAEAARACADGDGGCTKAGCIPGHQASEVLDEVERLTAERDDALAETATALADGKEEAARLRERVATWEKLAEGYYERALAGEAERDDARREVCEMTHNERTGTEAYLLGPESVAKGRGWPDLYGGTPTGATPSDCTTIEREHGEEWMRTMGDCTGEPGGES